MAWWPSGGFDDRWAHAVLWASALHRDLAGAALLREGPTGAGRRGTPPGDPTVQVEGERLCFSSGLDLGHREEMVELMVSLGCAWLHPFRVPPPLGLSPAPGKLRTGNV